MANRWEITDGGSALQLVNALREVPRELRPEVRRAVKAAAETVRRGAQGNSSWSSRIPRSIRTRVAFARGARTAVDVRAGARGVPHARMYEDVTNRGGWSHPTFGHRDRSVYQRSRPYLFPAARLYGPRAVEDMQTAVRSVLRRNGL